MKFQQQLILDHNPAEGRYGDCYRTCIAILLGLEAHEVPHFVEYSIWDEAVDSNGNSKGEQFNHTIDLARAWLLQRGYTLLACDFHHNVPMWSLKRWTAGLPFILSVNGSFLNTSHAMIGQVVEDELRGIWCPTMGCPRSNFGPWRCMESGEHFYSAEVIVKIPENML